MNQPVLIQLDRVCLGVPDDPDEQSVRRLLDFMQQASNTVSMLRWLDAGFAFCGETYTSTTSVTIQFCSS